MRCLSGFVGAVCVVSGVAPTGPVEGGFAVPCPGVVPGVGVVVEPVVVVEHLV